MEELHISILFGDETLEAIPSGGYFSCPLCPEDAGTYSEEGYLDHVAAVHSKSKLIFEEFTILKCMRPCLQNRRRGHYHCPQCAKIIFSRGDLVYHIKGHEAKKGKKSKRGRRRGLSSVLQHTNTEVELFNSMTCVVSAQCLSLFHSKEALNEYFADLSSKYEIQCYIPKEDWCIIQGKWKGIQQAKQALEELAVRAIEKEKLRVRTFGPRVPAGGAGEGLETVPEGEEAEAAGEGAVTTGTEGTGGGDGADVIAPGEEEGMDDATGDEEVDPDGARRSGRKRKLNEKYSKEYLVSKLTKTDDGSAVPGAGAAGDGDGAEKKPKEDDNPVEKLLSRTNQDVKIQFAEDASFSGLSMTVVLSKPELIAEEVTLAIEPPPLTEYDLQDEFEEEEEILFKDDPENDPSVTLNTLQGEDSMPSPSHWYVKAEEGDDPLMVEELYTCNACHHQMTGREALGAHVSQCTNPAELTLVFKCAGCNVTGDEESIKAHFVEAHFADLNGCHKCRKVFKSATSLKSHMIQKGHMSNKYPLMEELCPVCNKSVKVKNMRQHMKQVHEKFQSRGYASSMPGQAYGCICGKAYQSKHTLKMHQDKCATYLQHQFQEAANAALGSGNTAVMETLPQANYQCGYCQQNFADLETTKQHIALHIADVESTETTAVAVSDAGAPEATSTVHTVQQGDGTTLQHLAAVAGEGGATIEQIAAATEGGATIQQVMGPDGTIQQMAISADGTAVAIPPGTALITTSGQPVGQEGQVVVQQQEGEILDQSSLQHLALTAVEQQSIQVTGQQQEGGHLISIGQNGELGQIMAELPAGAVATSAVAEDGSAAAADTLIHLPMEGGEQHPQQ